MFLEGVAVALLSGQLSSLMAQSFNRIKKINFLSYK